LSLAIFVDYDGTITDVDTFDVLVRLAAGDETWHEFERELRAGRMTLRDALAREAACVRLSRLDALALLESRARIDPTFPAFVRLAHDRGAWIGVVSAGIRSIIGPALERIGVDVPLFANDVDFDAGGWRMTFIDESELGHDKAARVRAAAAAGARTVYVGDGISDFAGALAADVRFAKKGRALEQYCRERGVACTSFSSFDEISDALWP
jgi:HAD superfamily phosphoserine phosphatase-like hydrolase